MGRIQRQPRTPPGARWSDASPWWHTTAPVPGTRLSVTVRALRSALTQGRSFSTICGAGPRTYKGRRMSDAIVRLAQHVSRTRFEDLSPEAITAVKTFCLDTLGVCVAGTSAPYAAAVQTVARGWGTGAEATVIGLGEQCQRRPPPSSMPSTRITRNSTACMNWQLCTR